jgi:CheY-like chemotaxis protein
METVFVIDDDQIHHTTIEKTIQRHGFSKHVISFHNGYDALTFLHENLDCLEILPDIIFLDLNMPVISGWQFLQQFALIKSKIKKNVKVYLVSSSVIESDVKRAIASKEVSGYIEKPFRLSALIGVFSDAMVNFN